MFIYVFGHAYSMLRSFPGGSDGKEPARNAGDWIGSLGQEDPPEKGTATHSHILDWRMP